MRTRKGDTSGKQHGVLVEMSKGVKPWRQAVHAAGVAVQTPDWTPMDGALELTIMFFMLRPLSHPKTRHTYPITAPDLSKLVRSTEDALTTARVWADDARVVDMHVIERYAIPRQLHRLYVEGAGRENPGALIRVRRLTELAA